MKGPETFRSLSERKLLYLYEGPRDLQKPLGKEFVIPIGRAQRPSEASRKGNLLYLYEGPRDLQKPLGKEFERNLLCLYEGPRDLQKPLEKEFVIPI